MFNLITTFFGHPDEKDASFIRLTRYFLILTLATTLAVSLIVARALTISNLLMATSVLIALLLLETLALFQALNRLQAARAKTGALEQAQLEANQELLNLRASFEQRLDERTNELSQRTVELENTKSQAERRAAQLEALAQVVHTAVSVRDLRELLPQIAVAISNKFSFYHVGIFLLDEANEYAILSATNSEGGRKMMERKHRLRVGHEGIVGHVTSTGEPRIAMDVGEDAVFFDNPELPNTHSEMALPLKAENRIIGALDVQSTEKGAFTDDDIQMLSLLADQVGLAIENARLFDETRTALTEAQAISRQFTREAWGRVPVEHKLLGYRYSIAGASPLREPVEFAAVTKAQDKHSPKGSNQVAIPIELRGETIGILAVQSPSDDPLTQEQINLIKAVAERVALAAENARLFDETTRRAERERLVSDITGKIRSVNDPQTMVQTAMEELRRALGASRVEVIPQAVKGAE